MSKTIYTSYFSSPKVKNILLSGDAHRLISIARYRPHWFRPIDEYLHLAPSDKLLKDYKQKGISKEEYTERYTKQILDTIDKQGDLAIEDGSILLCYEKTEDFCHRHILAGILRGELGLEVVEL